MNKHSVLAWVSPEAEPQTKALMQVIYLSHPKDQVRDEESEHGKKRVNTKILSEVGPC